MRGDRGPKRHFKQMNRKQSKRIHEQMGKEGRLGKSWRGLGKEMPPFTNHLEFFRDVTNFSKREIWSSKAFPKDLHLSPKLMKKLSCCGMSE